MTPRTRTSNQDAKFTVYYSKKVPKQVYFPHRRKIVREKPASEQDAPEPRQLTFLPEKMRRRSTVADSEDSEDEDEENVKEEFGEDEQVGQNPEKITSGSRKRRPIDTEDEQASEEYATAPTQPTPKRRRKAQDSNCTGTPRIVVKSEHKDGSDSPASELSTSEKEKEKVSRRKRQSTMTQLVEGRRPLRGGKEPEFKPTGRWSRTSGISTNGDRKSNGQNKKQRTLTQMVPGLVPIGMLSNDDMDDELDDLEIEVAGPGAIQSRPTPVGGAGDSKNAQIKDQNNAVEPADAENAEEDEESAEYQPTQFIDAPVLRERRSLQRKARNTTADSTPANSTPRKAAKSRFSLLATPERRRIVEIPSSQSPAASPLSTQVTPSRAGRQPLSARTSNIASPNDTPSKRKQVTFHEEVESMPPPPLPLKKFGSVVEDSEDEEDDMLEEDILIDAQDIGAVTQALLRGIVKPVRGKNIGAETQAIVDEIDQACASVEDDGGWNSRGSSEEHDAPTAGQAVRDISEELGEQRIKSPSVLRRQSRLEKIKAEPYEDDISKFPEATNLPHEAEDMGAGYLSYAEGNADSTKSNLPSSPLVIKDESDSDNDDPIPTPPRFQASTDLDGELIHVPRSPTPSRPETQETTHSHTSKAEQQLQSEWKSYSQYRRGPLSSSMHVAHESDPFSYQETPHRHHTRGNAPQRSLLDISQATTIDYTQPSPNNTPNRPGSRIISAKTTPRKIVSSQPTVSPAKPPPLFIPSSFPSPGRAGYGEWSSPVTGRDGNGRGYFTQLGGIGSIEDFSIPPLPPLDDDDMFEE